MCFSYARSCTLVSCFLLSSSSLVASPTIKRPRAPRSWTPSRTWSHRYPSVASIHVNCLDIWSTSTFFVLRSQEIAEKHELTLCYKTLNPLLWQNLMSALNCSVLIQGLTHFVVQKQHNPLDIWILLAPLNNLEVKNHFHYHEERAFFCRMWK